MTVDRKHAILSASGSERWLNCTPSARLEELRSDTRSDAAEEGTLGHALAEMYLRAWLDNDQMLPPDYELATHRSHRLYTKDLEAAALEFVDYAKERFTRAKAIDPSARMYTETRADFSEWVPQGFGTADVCLIYGDTLETVDAKFGKGVVVSAIDNSQTRLYTLGKLRDYQEFWGITKVITSIHQPRLDRQSSEELTVTELLAWANDYVKPRAALAWEGEGDFVPGAHCQFCKIAPTCKARIEEGMAAIKEAFGDPVRESPTLTNEELGVLLPRLKLAKALISSMERHALQQAASGFEIPNHKLVEGRSVRKITDDLKAAEALTAAGTPDALLWTRTLLGITDLERAVGKKAFKALLTDNGLVVKAPGKLTLVEDSDPRPAVDRDAEALAAFQSQPLDTDE